MKQRIVFDAGNPVIRDHRAFGQAILPGLSYIDIALQFFRDQGENPLLLSLRNMALYRPLAVAGEERVAVDVTAAETAAGWKLQMADERGQVYVTMEVVRGPETVFQERMDGALPTDASPDLETIYARCRQGGLVHEGFMKAAGTFTRSDDGLVAEIRLPDCAVAAAARFLFHPTLLDGASLATGMAFADVVGEDEALFLPLSLGAFRWSAPLREHCFARARHARVRRQGNLLIRDLEFFDGSGRKVAEIERFVCTILRDPAHVTAIGEESAARTDDGEAGLMVWLRAALAQPLGIAAGQIDAAAGFYELGLDSAAMLSLTEALGERLAQSLPPTLLFEHTSLNDLARHLAVSHPAAVSTAFARAPAPARQAAQPGRPRAAGSDGAEPIAIIGLAGRYPAAPDLAAFWRNLCAGADCVTEIPASRWNYRDYADLRSRTGRPISHWGGFIEAPDAFDARFFRISPREAEMMDPQERWFMQICWEAMEDAGYTPETLAPAQEPGRTRRVGVFAGVMHKDYTLVVAEAAGPGGSLPLSLNAAQIANRVSFFCGFHGPSLTVDTVCSSSLVAVHLAIESLRRGETDVCLAGGVNLSLHPAKYLTYGQGNLFSTDGRCRAFGAGGDGYVPAEGVGAAVLKPLRLALADRDPIYAVIRGSAVNHVGHVSGFTVPSPAAQADLVMQAWAQAGIEPGSLDYVEAHGTGTALGDPIEIEGLTKAFRTGTEATQVCAIGSVKSNIGHAEAAAGISGLTKLALQLHHRTLVPSLHAEETNPHIDFAASPFYVQRVLEPWPEPGASRPRRGGVSSFGATGTNAHLVLEEAPAPATASGAMTVRQGPCLLPLSAQTEARLRVYSGRIAAFLADHADLSLADLAYTFQTGRRVFEHRALFAASGTAELQAALAGFARGGAAPQPPDTALARAWLAGEACDWSTLDAGQALPRRMHAPTYPFAPDRHWVPLPVARGQDVLVAIPGWEPVPGTAPVTAVTRILLPVLRQEAPPSWLAEAGSNPEFERLPVGGDGFEDLAAALFTAIKQHHADARPALPERAFWQIILPEGLADGMAPALSGLCLTAAQEYPRLTLQLVDLAAADLASPAELRRALARASSRPDAALLRHRGGLLSARSWTEPAEAAQVMPWRDRGVYLITGGAGGLGLLWAAEIARRVAQPRIILTGRSARDPARQAALDALRGLGAEIRYEPVDVTSAEAVSTLVRRILDRDGGLHGVIHSAGVVADGRMSGKTEATFRAVMAPKIAGSRHLDAATAACDLDLFLLFSSGAGVFGNEGQADYATANAWMGAFAGRRQAQVRAGQRRGQTLALHWPLWADGGMRPSAEMARLWQERIGLEPLTREAGVTALYRALGLGQPEVLVLAGDLARLRRSFAIGPVGASEPDRPMAERALPAPLEGASGPDEAEPELRQAVLARLKQILCDITKLPVAEIRADEALDHFGFDSVMVVQFGQALSGLSAQISHTVFYECGTLRGIAAHLCHRFPEACRRWSGQVPSAPASPARAPAVPARPVAAPAAREPAREDAIAIIGLAGRYPQAPDLQQFWANLLRGHDAVCEIPETRWALTDFFEADRRAAVQSGRSYGKWGGFLADFAQFDPLFFQISPMEAAAMDPQERLFLETAWQVFEDAGYSRAEIQRQNQGRVGVFAGITRTGFNLYAVERWRAGDVMLPATSFSSIANRISYVMNLNGPSLPVDTMCSSSLTAVHEACAHLRRGDCDMALAGGVNLHLHPLNYVSASAQQMLSPDGRCKSFGAGANGYVPGEGVGAVLLKRLAEAERDGDQIHAIIRATGINHNGRTHGYTVPNPRAQRDLIRSTIARAGIDPASITAIEAHGTGTELGDPIEVEALQAALAVEDAAPQPARALASVKSNIGHLEAAAGIAGLTKIVLQLRHRQIVPSLHAQTPNPKIDLAAGGFYVPQAVQDWPALMQDGVALPRRAGISSFGAGGANAHVILEEYVADPRPRPDAGVPVLVVLSARSKAELSKQAAALLRHIEIASPDLASLAFTLQVGREAFAERLAIVAGSLADLRQSLAAVIEGLLDRELVHRGKAGDAPAIVEALCDDPGTAALLSGWARDGRLSKIAALWVQGVSLDWRMLYPGVTPRRISLPTYPFARQEFWIAAAAAAPAADSAPRAQPQPQPPRDQSAGLMYKPAWHRLSADWPQPDHAAPFEIIAHAASSSDLAGWLAERRPGAQRLLLPDQAEQLRRLAAGAPRPVRLWLLADAAAAAAPAAIEEAGLALLAALHDGGLAMPLLDLRLVTRNVTDGSVFGAGLHGLCHAWRQSGLAVTCCDIDEAELSDASMRPAVLDLLGRAAPSAHGDILQLRHGAAFTTQLQPVTLPVPSAAPALRKAGRYVIIGGAGLLGRIISRYLIAQYEADIVWIGRTGPDDAGLRAKLDAFIDTGRMPLYLQADATDAAALADAVAGLPAVSGVIFAAMEFAFGTPFDVSAAAFSGALRTKRDGSWNSFEVFRDQPLDFLCYFSSIQAYAFADAGNSTAYAAGISAGDAAARQAAAQAGFPVGIIHWGFWRSAIAGTILERNSGALDEPEALACFEAGLSLIRAGSAVDMVCMRPPAQAAQPLPLQRITVQPLPAAPARIGLHVLSGPPAVPPAAAGLAERAAFLDSVIRAVLAVLRRMGGFADDRPASLAALASQAGITPGYHRWLGEILGVLEAAGLVETSASGHRLAPAGRALDPAQAMAAWGAMQDRPDRDPTLRPMIALLRRCLGHLPEILRGQQRATDQVFPQGQIASLGRVYEGNDWSDFFNDRLGDAVVALVEDSLRLAPGKVVRIVEIGAGTGGTSRAVLARLAAYAPHLHYLYTDLSPAFVEHGRQAFSQSAPFTEFRRWNIAEAPERHGIDPGSYDIVIATNVLHATADLRLALRCTKAALRPKGVLLLNETVWKTLFGTLTFGLLDGWWAFTDAELRLPGAPLLSPSQWLSLLGEEGFGGARCLTEPVEAAAQCVMAAQSDGWLRQAQAARSAPASPQRPLVPVPAPVPVAGESGQEMRRLLRACLAEVLNIAPERIDGRTPFSDYGVDSIVGTQLVTLIGRRLGVHLNAAILYEHTYLEALAGHLAAVAPAPAPAPGPAPAAPAAPAADPSVMRALETAFLDGAISVEDVLQEVG